MTTRGDMIVDNTSRFHSIFVPFRKGSRELNWFFICPSCGTHYDIGLKALAK